MTAFLQIQSGGMRANLVRCNFNRNQGESEEMNLKMLIDHA